MGVDIMGYTKIRRLGDSDDDYDGDGFHAYDNTDFPGRAGSIKTGWYDFDNAVDGLSLSYGGYNWWRRELAELAGWPRVLHEGNMRADAAAWRAKSGPFWELINFADNEGTIGTIACAKLAREFAEYQAKADAHPDEEFRRHYASMRQAFEAAADDGAVNFS